MAGRRRRVRYAGGMSTCVFVQIRCTPGKTYEVAEAIWLREIVSEMYSTSGDYDLITKIYVPEGEDIGKYLARHLFDVPGIARSLTTMTFSAITMPGEG